jgi:hypothetical protein
VIMIVLHVRKGIPAELLGQTDQCFVAAVEKGISGMNQRIKEMARELGLFSFDKEKTVMATVPVGRCHAVDASVRTARTPRSR